MKKRIGWVPYCVTQSAVWPGWISDGSRASTMREVKSFAPDWKFSIIPVYIDTKDLGGEKP